MKRDRRELKIYDTCIIDASQGGLTYIDDYGRKHRIDYSVCAKNYAEINDNKAATCVGERDITKMFFSFYTQKIPIKIFFKSSFVLNRKTHLLTGSKTKRFEALQKAIMENGYTTYDLS